MSVKWAFKSKYSFANKNFARIYQFFVVETPVPGVSMRGKSFKVRGCNMRKLNSALKKETPFLKTNWQVKPIKDIPNCCKTAGIDTVADFSKEIAIHTINGKHCTGNVDSLFYTVRCAFAHGAFSIHTYKKEKYYLLENKDGTKLKGRLVLKEDTLIKWIELLERLYP